MFGTPFFLNIPDYGKPSLMDLFPEMFGIWSFAKANIVFSATGCQTCLERRLCVSFTSEADEPLRGRSLKFPLTMRQR
jgi:hypothetical protein